MAALEYPQKPILSYYIPQKIKKKEKKTERELMPFMKKKVNIISSQTAAWTNNIKKRKNETQENGHKQWVVCCRFCLQDSVEHRSCSSL